MKKSILLLAAGCLAFTSFGQTLTSSLVSSRQCGDLDNDYRNLIIEISRDNDNEILVKATNLYDNKETEAASQPFLTSGFTAERSGNALLLRYHAAINPLYTGGEITVPLSSVGIMEHTYRIEDVPADISGIKFVYDDEMLGFGLKVFPVSLYHYGALGNGEAVTLTPEANQNSNLVSNLKEWVVYNPSDSEGKPRFFRLRFHGGESTDRMEAYYNYLWLYEGTEFDTSKAIKIAKVYGDGNYECLPEDVDVPSSFWGTGFKSAPKLSKWRPSNSEPYTPYVINGRDGEFDVYSSFIESLQGHIISDEPISLNGKNEGHILVTESGYQANEELPWKGEWITGIGAVGDWYASNPIFPIYDLPMGVTPAYLLYVRNIANNDVIYGDSSLDPDFALLKTEPGLLGVENVSADKSGASWNITAENVVISAEGKIFLSIYAADGRLVDTLSGNDILTADLSELSAGTYILHATTAAGSTSRKLMR